MCNSLLFGGVLQFYNAGKILILNSLFENNFASKGGALYFNYDETKGKIYALLK